MPTRPDSTRDISTRFAERLRAARTEAGLSQASLAAAVRTTPKTILFLENCRRSPSLSLAARLADRLGMPDLLGEFAPKKKKAEKRKTVPGTT